MPAYSTNINSKIYTWKTYTGFPNIEGSSIINVGTDIYIIGGLNSSQNIKYNTIDNTFTALSSMGQDRWYMASTYYDGKIYCIGGSLTGTTYTNFNQVYDIASNYWTTLSPIMNEGTRRAAIHAKDGYIYLFSGTGSTASRYCKIYNISTNTWILGSYSEYTAGYAGTSVLIDNYVHLIGFSYSNKAYEIYDIKNNSFSTKTSMPIGRSYSAGCIFKNKIVVIGGMGYNRVDSYNLDAELWGTLLPIPASGIPLQQPCVIDDKIYVFMSTGGILFIYSK